MQFQLSRFGDFALRSRTTTGLSPTMSPPPANNFAARELILSQRTRPSSLSSLMPFLFVSPVVLSRTLTRNPPRRCRRVIAPVATAKSSSALKQDNHPSRYIDLRTMQVIHAHTAHLFEDEDVQLPFPLLADIELDPPDVTLRDLLFTDATVPLSESQADVIYTLLSGRSVLYHQPNSEDRFSIFVDMVLRSRLWKQRLIYCANSERMAETVYTVLCSQLGPDRAQEIRLELTHCSPSPSQTARVLITTPQLLRTRILDLSENDFDDANILFVDHLTVDNLLQWEELLFSVSSDVLLCVYANYLPTMQRQLLPLWIESIQNPLKSLAPPGGQSILDRIEHPHQYPLLRTFAYNAANHEYPVQVSLTLLKEVVVKEISQSSSKEYVPDYAQCFLSGITVFSAIPPSELMFFDAQHAEYADLSSILVAEVKRINDGMPKRRRMKVKRKERTASSKAAARKRREAVYADSPILPAIGLVCGRDEAMHAAHAVLDALGDQLKLLFDDDSALHLRDIIGWYVKEHEKDLSELDREILKLLSLGIALVSSSCTPDLQLLIEEVFRSGLVPFLVADTYLGSEELCTLPSAKTVFIESSALGACDDKLKGMISAQTAASLAGRPGRDDAGNLIVLWYDESVDDEMAGYEIASTLLEPLFEEEERAAALQIRRSSPLPPTGIEEAGEEELLSRFNSKKIVSPLSSSYDGVLRAAQRFGLDGYERIFDFSLNAYRGWLERATIHATLEKIQVEQKEINEQLSSVDWTSIAEYERREAKLNESMRVLRAMKNRYQAVLESRIVTQLRGSEAGRIIGIVRPMEGGAALPWTQQISRVEDSNEEIGDSKENSEAVGTKTQQSAHADSSADVAQSDKRENAVSQKPKDKKEIISEAVFVAVLDQRNDRQIIDGSLNRFVIICILPDGMWTALPARDVVAIADEREEIISNVDLLELPHPATFDRDPDSNWAKCRAIDDTEKAAVSRVSDELIGRMASEDRPLLSPFKIAEFEAQHENMQLARDIYQQSPWYGRDDEIIELRKLRRKVAGMDDKIKWLERSESQLEERLSAKHDKQRSIQSALMAVLEDCHGVSVTGDHAMEMTPIGALAAILPCEHPVFTAACLSLIDEVENLSPAHLASFVAEVACTGERWHATEMRSGSSTRDDDEEDSDALDLSIIQKAGNGGDNKMILASSTEQIARNTGFGEEYLPMSVQETVNEIEQALLQLHRRHVDANHGKDMHSISEIVPISVNKNLAWSVGGFVKGMPWHEFISEVGGNNRRLVTELRRVRKVLDVMSDPHGVGEFSEKTQALAKMTRDALDRWPVAHCDIGLKLIELGAVEKRWNVVTYDKWWRSVKLNFQELRKFSKKTMATEPVVGAKVEPAET